MMCPVEIAGDMSALGAVKVQDVMLGAGPHILTKAAPLVAVFDGWALRALICWSLVTTSSKLASLRSWRKSVEVAGTHSSKTATSGTAWSLVMKKRVALPQHFPISLLRTGCPTRGGFTGGQRCRSESGDFADTKLRFSRLIDQNWAIFPIRIVAKAR